MISCFGLRSGAISGFVARIGVISLSVFLVGIRITEFPTERVGFILLEGCFFTMLTTLPKRSLSDALVF